MLSTRTSDDLFQRHFGYCTIIIFFLSTSCILLPCTGWSRAVSVPEVEQRVHVLVTTNNLGDFGV